MTQPCVQVRDIGMRFGGLQALDQVSFDLFAGEATALIGPNGAGKTTMINIISGGYRPTSGTVTVNGADITRTPAHKRTEIARTFQISQVFKGMTVLENVMVGLQATHGYGLLGAMLRTPRVARLEKEARERSMQMLEQLGIASIADRDAGTLPLGQERLLEVARALATGPKVVLLDEVASGLTPHDREVLAQRVGELRERGYAVLVVEHNMKFVKDTAQHLVVLNFGARLYTGPVEEGLRDERVLDAYLGRAHQEGPDHA